jgi:surface antigen
MIATRRHRPAGFRPLAAFLALGFVLPLLAAPAKADPPPWAPAHGWRDKHHGHGDDDDDEDHDRDRGHRPHGPPPAPVAEIPYGLGQRTCYRELIGGALGGAAGGLIGSNIGKGEGRTAATIGGVLAGILVGGSIGRAMDQVDQACAGQVLERVPDRQTIVWQNPDAGSSYWVTPMRTYQAAGGEYCREYRTTALIGGGRQTVTGTACRQPDGSWRIVQ